MISYSQPATKQDLWVVDRLGAKPRPRADSYYSPGNGGYFVEVGAHDGVRHSNSMLLEEKYGWKGLLIEPNSELFEKLQRNRPNTTATNALIGREDNKRVRFLQPPGDSASFGGIEEFMPLDWREEHIRRQSPGEYRLTCSLATILATMQTPRVIDYLSLDVEGAELPILEGYYAFAEKRDYIFKIITVEFRYDKFLLDQIETLLRPWYKLEHVQAFDAFFVRHDLDRISAGDC